MGNNRISMPRPTTSNADEWQLWLQDGLQGEPATGCTFLAVQIVEAIEEHQKALAREVYGLAENTAGRFSDLASEDTPQGHFYRGSIHEAKSIARAINAIMPYSRDPSALAHGGRQRLATQAVALDAQARLIEEAREVVELFLQSPEIADCAPDDKDPETAAAESRARAFLTTLPAKKS